MKKAFTIAAALALLCSGVVAGADVFNLGPGIRSLETVTVGDAGNAADTTGYGSVDYTYNIGKYNVTAAQYCDFLNAVAATDTYGLYNASMSSYSGCGITRTGAPAPTCTRWQATPSTCRRFTLASGMPAGSPTGSEMANRPGWRAQAPPRPAHTPSTPTG